MSHGLNYVSIILSTQIVEASGTLESIYTDSSIYGNTFEGVYMVMDLGTYYFHKNDNYWKLMSCEVTLQIPPQRTRWVPWGKIKNKYNKLQRKTMMAISGK